MEGSAASTPICYMQILLTAYGEDTFVPFSDLTEFQVSTSLSPFSYVTGNRRVLVAGSHDCRTEVVADLCALLSVFHSCNFLLFLFPSLIF